MQAKNMDSIRLHVTHTTKGRTFLVAAARGTSDAASTVTSGYEQIALELAGGRLDIVHERVFGSLSLAAEAMATRSRVFENHGISTTTPVTYIEGRPPWGEGWAGVLVSAVQRTGNVTEMRTLWDEGRPCGRVWSQDGAIQAILQGITGHRRQEARSSGQQVARAIQQADHLLREVGLSYRDVARTWFYISNVLDWYAEFNHVRTACYQELGLLSAKAGAPVVLPASTGIGARAPGGSAISLDLIAVSRTTTAPVSITQLSNSGQQEAIAYGSAFARAVLICITGLHLLELSGTAAVDEQGRSLFPNDARAQIICTFEKVGLLLGQVNAGLNDIVMATAFVKHARDAAVFQEVLATLGLTNLPVVCVVADICRPELLFELDAEVWVPPADKAGTFSL